MGKTFAFLKKEFLEMIPPTIFFLVIFELIVVFRVIMGLENDAYTLTGAGTALVMALILGKSILIADATPLFTWFSRQRLIFNVLWRILLYLLVVLLFQLLEELIPLWRRLGSAASAFAELGNTINWVKVGMTHLILAVFLSFYALVTAMISVIGRERFIAVFFTGAQPGRGE